MLANPAAISIVAARFPHLAELLYLLHGYSSAALPRPKRAL